MFSVLYHGYVNPSWYDSLSDRSKTALAKAGKKAAQWALEATEQAAKAAPRQLADKNAAVHIHTADQIEVIAAVMRPKFDEAFCESAGEDGKTILRLLEKLRQ